MEMLLTEVVWGLVVFLALVAVGLVLLRLLASCAEMGTGLPSPAQAALSAGVVTGGVGAGRLRTCDRAIMRLVLSVHGVVLEPV